MAFRRDRKTAVDPISDLPRRTAGDRHFMEGTLRGIENAPSVGCECHTSIGNVFVGTKLPGSSADLTHPEALLAAVELHECEGPAVTRQRCRRHVAGSGQLPR